MGKPRHRWVDNVGRDTRDLGSDGTWTKRSIGRDEQRRMIVAALGSGGRCGQCLSKYMIKPLQPKVFISNTKNKIINTFLIIIRNSLFLKQFYQFLKEIVPRQEQ